MSDRAGGGDFVVIRASGADGYNQYVFDLGNFDSVETLVLKNRAASSDACVLQVINNAEALFIAGGDQSNYVDNWKGTPVEDAIHALAARGVPIGGTSAGTAIMSEVIYAALRQSVTSSQALADPFNQNITLDREFLALPLMQGIITDQHLIERDRIGRTLTFMARIVADGWAPESKAIAIDRETAVLVEASGRATIVARRRATGRDAKDAADVPERRRAARGARQHVRRREVEGNGSDRLYVERQRRRDQLDAAGWVDLLTR